PPRRRVCSWASRPEPRSPPPTRWPAAPRTRASSSWSSSRASVSGTCPRSSSPTCSTDAGGQTDPMTLALYARRARARILDDLDAAIARDPAAASRLDVALNSPGLHAIWVYRFAHRIWMRGGLGRPAARLVMTAVRSMTGVEIHPAAVIGHRFFIDHGMGV